MARQPPARLDHRRRARSAGSSAASAASRRTRRSSRRRSTAAADYDEQFGDARRRRRSRSRTPTGSWSPTDIEDALAHPAPGLRRERRRRRLRVGRGRARPRPRHRRHHRRGPRAARAIDEPNLFVKIPGTAEGVARDPADDRRGPQHQRHAALRPRALRRGDRGLPRRARGAADGGDLSHGRAAWRRSSSAGSTPRSTAGSRRSAPTRRSPCGARPRSPTPSSPTSCSASASPGARWEALAARGAKVQRPLWASTSTKNPDYPDTLYVDTLIGPDTVNTMPEATLEAFEDHGTLARTVDADLDGARAVHRRRSAAVGVDLDDVDRDARGRRRRRRSRSPSTSCSPALETKADELDG